MQYSVQAEAGKVNYTKLINSFSYFPVRTLPPALCIFQLIAMQYCVVSNRDTPARSASTKYSLADKVGWLFNFIKSVSDRFELLLKNQLGIT